MLIVALACLVLVVATTVIHYEALRGLSAALGRVEVSARFKLVIVILVAFVAHASEILLYGLAFLWLIAKVKLGGLGEPMELSLVRALYFSAETYTSLGYGDIFPTGAIRMLAGVETLNGLLLIGWSASYTYLAMERYWKIE